MNNPKAEVSQGFGDAGLHVLVINGWSMPDKVWDGFLDELSGSISFSSQQVIDLDQSLSVDQWVNYIDEKVSPNTLLVGWSLGGMLAVEYASRKPEKIAGLCCLQMNPRFVAVDGWSSAMDRTSFKTFLQLVKDDIASMIKQFGFMATTQGLDALSDLRQLKKVYKGSSAFSPKVLQSTLALLGDMDVRQNLKNLPMPQLYIYGEHDKLVPVTAASEVNDLLQHSVSGKNKLDDRCRRVKVIPTMAHCPLYSAANEVAAEVRLFAGVFS